MTPDARVDRPPATATRRREPTAAELVDMLAEGIDAEGDEREVIAATLRAINARGGRVSGITVEVEEELPDGVTI